MKKKNCNCLKKDARACATTPRVAATTSARALQRDSCDCFTRRTAASLQILLVLSTAKSLLASHSAIGWLKAAQCTHLSRWCRILTTSAKKASLCCRRCLSCALSLVAYCSASFGTAGGCIEKVWIESSRVWPCHHLPAHVRSACRRLQARFDTRGIIAFAFISLKVYFVDIPKRRFFASVSF